MNTADVTKPNYQAVVVVLLPRARVEWFNPQATLIARLGGEGTPEEGTTWLLLLASGTHVKLNSAGDRLRYTS